MHEGLKCVFSLYLFFTFSGFAFSQYSPDTIRLGEVTITEKYMPDITGLKTLTIDSATLQNLAPDNISAILAGHTSLTVKSYGPGGNASPGFRGTGASHTQFLWNGVNINSSMLGQADLNMLPNFFADNISVYHGGASLVNNSGAFGGSVNITNKPDWNRKFGVDAMQVAGSWDTYGSYLKTVFGNKLFHSTTRLFYNGSENNYPYQRYEGGETQYNENARYHTSGFIHELYLRPDSDNVVSAIVWMQEKQNNFPGFPETIHQETVFGRAVAEWTLHKGNFRLTSRAAHLQGKLNFSDKNAFIESRNTEKTSSGSADAKFHLNEIFNLTSGVSLTNSSVITNNYLFVPSRDQVSFSAGLNGIIPGNKLKYLFVIKQEIYDSLIIPVIPSAGLELAPFDRLGLLFKTNISRNYHMPTMNDLYWNLGGNPGLKPEQGYFFEAGTSYSVKSKNGKHKAVAEATFFYHEIINNIIWAPGSYSNYWSPRNFGKTRSEGVEMHADYSLKYGKTGINFYGNYSYISAINASEDSSGEASSGKQLIYVPCHSGNAGFYANRSNYYLGYSFTFSGIRYIYTDNSWYMPPYMVSDIHAGITLKPDNWVFSIQASIANITNTDYQVVPGYPMMRRNYRITLRVSVF